MFIGHFAIGMAAKKIEPSVSLGTLFLSAQFLDLLWPTLLLLDVEHVSIDPGASKVTPLAFIDYPVSHSLVAVIGWSLLLGLIYYFISKDKRASLLVGCLVLSHWILDAIVHVPDLPLFPGQSPKIGLGVWNNVPLTILIEGVIFVAGVVLYINIRKSQGRNVNAWFWSLMAFLLIVHIMNLTGPPPPSVSAIAWAGHLQWLFVLWGWLADRLPAGQAGYPLSVNRLPDR
jgi:hypothetical protein